jgi:hypothetical protein
VLNGDVWRVLLWFNHNYLIYFLHLCFFIRKERVMKTYFAACVIALSAGSVWAQNAPVPATLTTTAPASVPSSTPDMVAVCSKKYEPLARNFCYGFGEGVYQLYKSQLGNTPDSSICFKAGAQTRDQVLDLFVAWASARPDLASSPAAGTIMLFLRQQYPCIPQ